MQGEDILAGGWEGRGRRAVGLIPLKAFQPLPPPSKVDLNSRLLTPGTVFAGVGEAIGAAEMCC